MGQFGTYIGERFYIFNEVDELKEIVGEEVFSVILHFIAEAVEEARNEYDET